MNKPTFLAGVMSFLIPSLAIALTDEEKSHESSLTSIAKERCSSEFIEGSDYTMKALADGKVAIQFFGKKGGDLKGSFVYSKQQWEGRQNVLKQHQLEASKDFRKCVREETASLRSSYSPPQIKKKEITETKPRVFEFSEQNDHCKPERKFAIPVHATDGWNIDTSSIDTTGIHKSKKSSFAGIRDLSRTKFTIEGYVRNNGTCGPAWRDARGNVWGVVKYIETRTIVAAQ